MKIMITKSLIYSCLIAMIFANESIALPYFFQEKRTFALEGQKVYSVAIAGNGDVYAGTESGLFCKPKGSSVWEQIPGIDAPTYLVAIRINKVVTISGKLKNNIITQGKVNSIQNKKLFKL